MSNEIRQEQFNIPLIGDDQEVGIHHFNYEDIKVYQFGGTKVALTMLLTPWTALWIL